MLSGNLDKFTPIPYTDLNLSIDRLERPER
jgi:hypothetical protein